MTKQKFLRGLAYDYLSDDEVIQGFAEHYLCAGLSSQDVCHDMCLYASASAAQEAGERLVDVFRILAGKEKQEPESFYAGALRLAADMARALEREMKELRGRVYEMPEKEERTDEN